MLLFLIRQGNQKGLRRRVADARRRRHGGAHRHRGTELIHERNEREERSSAAGESVVARVYRERAGKLSRGKLQAKSRAPYRTAPRRTFFGPLVISMCVLYIVSIYITSERLSLHRPQKSARYRSRFRCWGMTRRPLYLPRQSCWYYDLKPRGIRDERLLNKSRGTTLLIMSVMSNFASLHAVFVYTALNRIYPSKHIYLK